MFLGGPSGCQVETVGERGCAEVGGAASPMPQMGGSERGRRLHGAQAPAWLTAGLLVLSEIRWIGLGLPGAFSLWFSPEPSSAA